MVVANENGAVPHFHRSSCKVCEFRPQPPARISATGLCAACGERRHLEHNRQLREHDGEWFKHWRIRSIRALTMAPLDGPARPE